MRIPQGQLLSASPAGLQGEVLDPEASAQALQPGRTQPAKEGGKQHGAAPCGQSPPPRAVCCRRRGGPAAWRSSSTSLGSPAFAATWAWHLFTPGAWVSSVTLHPPPGGAHRTREVYHPWFHPPRSRSSHVSRRRHVPASQGGQGPCTFRHSKAPGARPRHPRRWLTCALRGDKGGKPCCGTVPASVRQDGGSRGSSSSSPTHTAAHHPQGFRVSGSAARKFPFQHAPRRL